MRRLTDEELFHISSSGLQEISDGTLELRISAAERRSLGDPDHDYQAAVAEEMLQHPEAV